MSKETLYPKHGNSPDRAENARETRSTGAPEGERVFARADAGVRILDLVKAEEVRDEVSVTRNGVTIKVLAPSIEVALDLSKRIDAHLLSPADTDLAWCSCGDAITSRNGGKCGNCIAGLNIDTMADELSAARITLASVQRERDEARAEVAEVDRVLGNRSVFDDCEGREEKIALAIREAAEVERLRAEVKRLNGELDVLVNGASHHPPSCPGCDSEQCERGGR